MWSDRFTRVLARLCAVALLLAPAGLVYADGGTDDLHQEVDGYRVEVVMQPQTSGLTPVTVRLTGADGQAVSNARVSVISSFLGDLSAHGHSSAEGQAGAGDQGHADADDHAGANAGDSHDDTAADDHGAGAADDHGAGDSHDDTAADDHGHDAAGGHDESVPHAHDETFLFQLSWDAAAKAYSGSTLFFQNGRWAFTVEFEVDGQQHAADFIINIEPPDRGLLVLAAFGGLSAAIIGVAFVMKRRSAAP
jgi:hypothetical protein